MKKRATLLIILLFALLPFSVFPQDNNIFQIVESVPVETTLDKSALPRPLDVWIEMINGASKTIDIETFYFANEKGEVLEGVLSAIKNAAERGVQVRVIIDKSFAANNENGIEIVEGLKNITVKRIPFKDIAGGVMHAKYFVVDGEDLFLGSQNMDWRALKHIHEIGVRIKNKRMAEMFLTVFEMDWNLCDNYDTEKNSDYKKEHNKIVPARIINSKKPLKIQTSDYGEVTLYPAFSPAQLLPKGFEKEETRLLKIIAKAKKKLCIMFYSYSLKGKEKGNLYRKMDDALRSAAKRGVSVKIIFSNWAIKKDVTPYIQELSAVPGIEIKFSAIPQYSGGYIKYARVDHSKMFTADNNISWVSTSNWEQGYFTESRNATLIMKSTLVNAKLNEVFDLMWNSPYVEKVDPEKEYKPVKRN
ncbi:MAG: phospholipase D-like domain-containing protein [Ignavibacteriae bacterium]|nr:phospholipase D-like domain-containing protein [Ignavibacteriota bacterium]